MITISVYYLILIVCITFIIGLYILYKLCNYRYTRGYFEGRNTAIVEILEQISTYGYISYEYDKDTNSYTIKYSDLLLLLNHYREALHKVQESSQ